MVNICNKMDALMVNICNKMDALMATIVWKLDFYLLKKSVFITTITAFSMIFLLIINAQ
jgi:hypothetical protein